MAHTYGAGRAGARDRRVAVVGFDSALEFWRDDSNLGSYEDCLDSKGNLVYADDWDLSQAVTTEADVGELGIALFAERPLDLLAPPGTRDTSALLRLRRVGWDLPEHSFVHGRDGVLVASPELLFLELAASYSFVELLKLGMELCGTYAIDPYAEDGTSDRRRICSATSIRRFLAKCPRVPGIAMAKDAASHLVDNSHSPLESKVILGLTLPAKKRGLGLWKPKLNDRREATKLQAKTIGEHTYFFDASWRGTLPSGSRYAVDCEIDSNAHFRDPQRVRSDGVRRDNVQYMRTLHISITTEDFNDVDRFVKKGLMIAHYIGQRICRYPRRGTDEEKAAFEASWGRRVNRLNDLLKELGSDAHPPRPRPRRGWVRGGEGTFL